MSNAASMQKPRKIHEGNHGCFYPRLPLSIKRWQNNQTQYLSISNNKTMTTFFTVFIVLQLLLTPSLLLLGQAPNTVRGNDELIKIECHNAEVPSTCIQCLKSDRRSENSDRVRIAAILVNCLQNHAKGLAGNMSALASGSKDQAMKNVFEECGRGFSSARKVLSSATLNLEKSKYDDAEMFVNEALQYVLQCHSRIGDHGDQIPKDVVYGMKLYEDLSEATDRIVERL